MALFQHCIFKPSLCTSLRLLIFNAFAISKQQANQGSLVASLSSRWVKNAGWESGFDEDSRDLNSSQVLPRHFVSHQLIAEDSVMKKSDVVSSQVFDWRLGCYLFKRHQQVLMDFPKTMSTKYFYVSHISFCYFQIALSPLPFVEIILLLYRMVLPIFCIYLSQPPYLSLLPSPALIFSI